MQPLRITVYDKARLASDVENFVEKGVRRLFCAAGIDVKWIVGDFNVPGRHVRPVGGPGESRRAIKARRGSGHFARFTASFGFADSGKGKPVRRSGLKRKNLLRPRPEFFDQQ